VSSLHLETRDVEDDKGRKALERFRIQEVDLGAPALFDAAYGALDAEFGPRGELERRSVIEGWLRALPDRTYHLLVARDEADRLAAVRDCHVSVDLEARAVVAYLAHVVVMPEHRRSGLASIMRAAPLALAREALKRAGPSTKGDLLLAAEMDPADPDVEGSIVRLVAYGRAGFAAIDPSCLPYCQPDFRELAALGVPPRPLPMLAVVRWIGHEGAPCLPKRFAEAFVRNLYAVFATHCRPEDLAEPRAHALAALAAHPAVEVPLLPLPKNKDDAEGLRPLLREHVLPHHSVQT
jgi:GNAT superfamily N-acetyltransferase